MPKVITNTTSAGIEIVSSFRTGARRIEAFATERAHVVGTFRPAINCEARLEVVGALPNGGQGRVWLYDATPGSTASRLISASQIVFTGTGEQRAQSPKFSLRGGRLYQIRAACVDASPNNKYLQIQDAAGIDV